MANRARDFVAKFFTDTSRFVTDKVEQGLDDVGHAATNAAKETEHAFDRIKRKVSDTGHETSVVGKETFGEAGKEVGAEFAQNVGQGLASGNIGTLAQDSAGGLVSAFANLGGPVGLALAPIAAVAAGVFASITASAAKMRADVQEQFDQLLSGADRQARIGTTLEQVFGGGSLAENLRLAGEEAQRAGVPVKDLVDALVNPKDSGKLTALLDAIRDKGTTTFEGVSRTGAGMQKSYTDAAQAANDILGKLDEAKAKQDLVNDAASIYAGLVADTAADLAAMSSSMGPGNVSRMASQLSVLKSQIPAAFWTDAAVAGGMRK